ncbi:MAG: hypothetical protein ACT4N5_02220 [Nitrosopumilaceae archaeon]
MLNFRKNGSVQDIPNHVEKIRILSSKIEQKIIQKGIDKNDQFVETLSVEELKDLRQVMMAADYLLSKYQDKKEIKEFLEEFVGIIMHAANSVNIIKDDMDDLLISAETALKQIQDLHYDVTQNLHLGQFAQKSLDEYKESKSETLTSPINLTNTTTPIYTHAYLTKTAVEI